MAVFNSRNAMAGGAQGSLLGPTGTIAGAAMGGANPGGLGGALNKARDIAGLGQFSPNDLYNPNADVFNQQLNPAQYQTAQIATGPQDQFRGRQMSLADALQAQSMGQGPSLAQSQLQQGLNQNIKNQMALAATQRGGSPGLGQRQLAQNIAGANQQAAMQAAQTRMAEQMSAREQLGGVLQGGRGQDIGLASSQADLQQQSNMANASAQNQFALQNQQNRMALEKLRADQSAGAAGLSANAYEGAAGRRQNFISGIGQGATSMAASDKNLKKNVKKSDYSGFGKALSMSSEDEKKNIKDAAFNTKQKTALESIKDSIGRPDQPKEEPEEKRTPYKAKRTGISSDRGALMTSAFSDMGLKEDVDEAHKGFLDKLTAYNYDYKEPEKFGEGRQLGVMAQDLEKSPIGKQAVVETDDGKMVDYGKLGGAMLASQVMLNDRLTDLEKAIRARKK